MAVLTGASCAETLTVRRPRRETQQPRQPHFSISRTFRPVEFHRNSASSSTDLSRKFSPVVPLKTLSRGPRSSPAENPTSNSDDGIQGVEEAVSPESPSGSQDRPPYVPGEQKKISSANVRKNAAQSALERAAAYKKLKKLGASSKQEAAPVTQPATDLPEIEIIRGQNVQSKLQPSNSPVLSQSESSASTPLDSSSPKPNLGNAAVDSARSETEKGNNVNVNVKRFTEENIAAARVSDSEDGAIPTAPPGLGKQKIISLAAFERAKAYKQQQTEMIAALREESPSTASGESGPASTSGASDEKVVEIEIITRDGVIKRKLMNPEEQIRAFSNVKDVKRQGASNIDFVGLGFADTKKSGRPAGLNESFAAPPTGTLPEVEILTRDAGIPQIDTAEQQVQDAEQLYKPRVSTWGVFPRPADISKTYGGGRTIRPGESLETDEERKVREARTQQLLADYRQKMGLDVDPKIKAETEEIVKQGDRLMDTGRLREALPLYELAMKKMPAQSELHGVAALQAAVCLDSLGRYDEARRVYEKLLAHRNGTVSKQARRFLFGFKAMEKLKVDKGYKWDASTYRQYFDSFADGYNTTYKADREEEMNENLVPYALLLLCPILLVFALVVSKSG